MNEVTRSRGRVDESAMQYIPKCPIGFSHSQYGTHKYSESPHLYTFTSHYDKHTTSSCYIDRKPYCHST